MQCSKRVTPFRYRAFALFSPCGAFGARIIEIERVADNCVFCITNSGGEHEDARCELEGNVLDDRFRSHIFYCSLIPILYESSVLCGPGIKC